MMNGLCCMWQMQGEEESREIIRRDIRIEYERQRAIDMKIQRHKGFDDNVSATDGSSIIFRRCQLILNKKVAAHDHHRGKILSSGYDGAAGDQHEGQSHSEPPSKSQCHEERSAQFPPLSKLSNTSSSRDVEQEDDIASFVTVGF